MKLEIVVKNKHGKTVAKRGKEREPVSSGGVVNKEINPATGHWRKIHTKDIGKIRTKDLGKTQTINE